MRPDEMTDEELLGPREITSCVEAEDGGWDVVYSCGHKVVFVIQPHMKQPLGCAECVNILVERRKNAAPDR